MTESELTGQGTLSTAERRERIRALVSQRGFVRVTELSESFGISDVAIRTDLDVLQRQHALRRVRGGAVPASALFGREAPFEEQQRSLAAEKHRIGEAAAAMVESGSAVILDVGTTAAAVARALVARADLVDVVIVTNGLNIALELEPAIPRFTVIVTGGTLRPLQHSLVFPLADAVLSGIHADIAFIGCNGVDPEGGVTNVNLPEAEVKKLMVGSADTRVIIADSAKIGRIELARIEGISEFTHLITGVEAAGDALESLRSSDLSIQEV